MFLQHTLIIKPKLVLMESWHLKVESDSEVLLLNFLSMPVIPISPAARICSLGHLQ